MELWERLLVTQVGQMRPALACHGAADIVHAYGSYQLLQTCLLSRHIIII